MKTETSCAMCFKKKRYSTSELADKLARRALKDRGVLLRSYYCPICFGYHLTKRE